MADRIWIDKTIPGQPWRVWTIEMTDLPEYVSRDVVDDALRRAWEAGRDAGADECDRLRASYARSAANYDQTDPLHGRIKYSGAAVAVASDNIRALTPPPDLGAEKETGE